MGRGVVDWSGKGVGGRPGDALIVDVTPTTLVGRAFGLQRGLDHAGAIIGPLVAWYLLAHGADVRRVILWSFAPGVIVVLLAIWAVKGGEGRRKTAEDAEELMAPSGVLRRPPAPLIAISLFYLLRMPETLLILRAQTLGIAIALVPLLWAMLHVVRSSTSFWGGALSDRIGPSRTMWLGWISYVALAAGLALAK